MKKIIKQILVVHPSTKNYDISFLVFRILLSVQMITTHGFKKIGIGVEEIENIPNPMHLPQTVNHLIAVTANLIFPLFVAFGFYTRLAVLPILAVTLTGYFVVHFNDSLLIKDIPFMYSLSYLLLLILGPGKYSIDYYLIRKIFK